MLAPAALMFLLLVSLLPVLQEMHHLLQVVLPPQELLLLQGLLCLVNITQLSQLLIAMVLVHLVNSAFLPLLLLVLIDLASQDASQIVA